jgi:hypothetical protein
MTTHTELTAELTRVAPHGVYRNHMGWWVVAGPGKAGRVCVERNGLTLAQWAEALLEEPGECERCVMGKVWEGSSICPVCNGTGTIDKHPGLRSLAHSLGVPVA